MVVASATAVTTSCGSEKPAASAAGSSASGETTTTAAMHSGTTNAPTEIAKSAGLGDCPQRMPGELLKADEAIVQFNTQMVCLGYVTVTEGTPIDWKNLDTATHTVTITDDDDQVLETFTIDAGTNHISSTGAPGIYRFTTTAIPSFVGSIEVRER